jgi:hypothetical protein
MAKAEINLPNGTKITVDGTPEEIIKIQGAFSRPSEYERKDSRVYGSKVIPKKKPNKIGPLGRIRNLIEEDYFKDKRTIEDVRKILEERAIFYKSSDIAPSLIRLVKKGELRRLKEDGQWRYVNS